MSNARVRPSASRFRNRYGLQQLRIELFRYYSGCQALPVASTHRTAARDRAPATLDRRAEVAAFTSPRRKEGGLRAVIGPNGAGSPDPEPVGAALNKPPIPRRIRELPSDGH
jgi:hypothetical protein